MTSILTKEYVGRGGMGVGDPNQKTVYHTHVLCSEQPVARLLSTHNSLLTLSTHDSSLYVETHTMICCKCSQGD